VTLVVSGVLILSDMGINKEQNTGNTTTTDTATELQPIKTGYADVNGLNYYYEITGKGEPLLFLHGGLFSIDMYAQLRSALGKNHQVIAVDL
jgi:hypothetical protein